MLALFLLAAHLVGDYLLQTRWQALHKFGWTGKAIEHRARHCTTYVLAFAPVAVVANPDHAGDFLALLWILHFLTDAQRFTTGFGEALWTRVRRREPLPPNPWPMLPLAIDQTLHVLQIAVLAGVFLGAE